MASLKLSRSQILSYRRFANHLDERLPAGAASLRLAAWGGLQDSAPRAALLSIHARVRDALPTSCTHHSLVQLWGPRYNNYVVAKRDLAVFSLGRLPEGLKARARAIETADHLHRFLRGRRLSFGEAGRGMGVVPNSLRYGATTGRLLISWDGARQPWVWSIPPPKVTVRWARTELARRFIHLFGPSTPESFAKWAGVKSTEAHLAWHALAKELQSVRTPLGEAWILAEDETAMRRKSRPTAPARLLPSGDTYFLMWGNDRKMLLPDAKQRASLWTSRVWPGVVMVNGEIVGVWRRFGPDVSMDTWRRLSNAEQQAAEQEAVSLPLPALRGPVGRLEERHLLTCVKARR